MPAFITQAFSFIVALLPTLAAFGAVTTAINQFVQKFLAPKFPRFGNVVNTVCVDYVAFVAEVAGAMNWGPRAKKPSNGTNTVVIVFLVGAIGLVGCSSFLHFSNPATQAVTCAILAPEEAIIESAAGICGPFAPACLSALQALFGDACTTAAAAGKSQDEAHAAGLAAVNAHASAMKLQLEKAGVKAP